MLYNSLANEGEGDTGYVRRNPNPSSPPTLYPDPPTLYPEPYLPTLHASAAAPPRSSGALAAPAAEEEDAGPLQVEAEAPGRRRSAHEGPPRLRRSQVGLSGGEEGGEGAHPPRLFLWFMPDSDLFLMDCELCSLHCGMRCAVRA